MSPTDEETADPQCALVLLYRSAASSQLDRSPDEFHRSSSSPLDRTLHWEWFEPTLSVALALTDFSPWRDA